MRLLLRLLCDVDRVLAYERFVAGPVLRVPRAKAWRRYINRASLRTLKKLDWYQFDASECAKPKGRLRDRANSARAVQASPGTGLRNDRKEILPCCGRSADDSAIECTHHAQAGHILPRKIETADRRSGS